MSNEIVTLGGARTAMAEYVGTPGCGKFKTLYANDLGARAIDAGPLRNAIALESLTPVLISINKRYKTKSAGIRITGIPE